MKVNFYNKKKRRNGIKINRKNFKMYLKDFFNEKMSFLFFLPNLNSKILKMKFLRKDFNQSKVISNADKHE